MRKVKYGVGVSLDGYIASVDGSIDWLHRATSNAKGDDFGMANFFKTIDTVLMGRKTYQDALRMGMQKGGYPKMKNYVFSRSLPDGVRDGVQFVSQNLRDVLVAMKAQAGKEIWLCGGGRFGHVAWLGWMILLIGAAIALPPLDSRRQPDPVATAVILVGFVILLILTLTSLARYFYRAWRNWRTAPNAVEYAIWLSLESLAAAGVLSAVLWSYVRLINR